MLHKIKAAFAVLAATLLVTTAQVKPAMAANTGHQAANFASHTGNIIYLAAAVGLPLLRDGAEGHENALRTADAIGTSVAIAEVLKNIVRERRPDHTTRDSFPSGHATAAFAAAGVESALHPKEAPLWYLGATLISASRVALHRHYIHDVLVGAALGYATAKYELSRPHGLILSPLIGRGDNGMSASFAMQF